jgi:hypothetical protein
VGVQTKELQVNYFLIAVGVAAFFGGGALGYLYGAKVQSSIASLHTKVDAVANSVKADVSKL